MNYFIDFLNNFLKIFLISFVMGIWFGFIFLAFHVPTSYSTCKILQNVVFSDNRYKRETISRYVLLILWNIEWTKWDKKNYRV